MKADVQAEGSKSAYRGGMFNPLNWFGRSDPEDEINDNEENALREDEVSSSSPQGSPVKRAELVTNDSEDQSEELQNSPVKVKEAKKLTPQEKLVAAAREQVEQLNDLIRTGAKALKDVDAKVGLEFMRAETAVLTRFKHKLVAKQEQPSKDQLIDEVVRERSPSPSRQGQ